MRPTDGGGGRILIDPTALRRGATRLRDVTGALQSLAGRVACPALPEMPDGMAAAVLGELGGIGQALVAESDELAQSADELERRAFWTEIADQLMAHAPLTKPQADLFMRWMKDGSLIRYAEPWQAELAGAYVGERYRDSYHDPDQLRELAGILRANATYDEAHGTFFAGLVDTFGAANVAHIPRVIQAMEWPGSYRDTGSYSDGAQDTDLMYRYFSAGTKIDGNDAIGMLSAFSMAVSIATYTGQLTKYSPDAEKEIAGQDDTWATAQLIAGAGEHRFGATFLRDAFQSVVVTDIQHSAASLGGKPIISYAPIGDHEPGAFPTDARTIVLQALLRNPHGAELALATPLPHDVFIPSSWGPVDTHNPVAVLYAADWQDHGKLFADIYKAATDYAQGQAVVPGTSTEGNHITLQLADRIIHGYRGDLGPVTGAFVDDVVRHDHIQSLIEASGGAGAHEDSDPTAGFLDPTTNRIYLNDDEMQHLFANLSHDHEADARLMHEIGDQQGAYIAKQVVEGDPKDAYDWGRKVGSFNQVLLNAHDLRAELDYEHAKEGQKLAILAITTPLHVLTRTARELAGGLGPSHAHVTSENLEFKLQTVGTVDALVATGYHEYGHLPDPQYKELLDGTHLKPYSSLEGPTQQVFDHYVLSSTADSDALKNAIQGVSDGMSAHAP